MTDALIDSGHSVAALVRRPRRWTTSPRRRRVACTSRILQVSSEGGRIACPGFSTCHASAWGQEGFVEAMAPEVAPFGTEMCPIEPGPTGKNVVSGIDMGKPPPDHPARAEAPDVPLRVPIGSVAWDNIDREMRARMEVLNGQRTQANACAQADGASS